MDQTEPVSRRRRWPAVLLVGVVLLGGLWSAGWYVAAGKVEETVAAWQAREARSGRIYRCASQTLGGFPFGISVRCADAAAELKGAQPLSVQGGDLVVSAQIWQPTVLTSTWAAPLSVGEPGSPAQAMARWSHAQVEVHGRPAAPEKVTITIDEPVLDRMEGPQASRLFQAARLDLQGTMLEGSAQNSPVIQLVLGLTGASSASLHPAAVLPVDAEITAVLRGLKDFSPKPWAARFRELQAADGRIQIVRSRIQQGESIAVARGELGLSPAGRLNGQLELTVANIDKLLVALGLNKAMPPAVDSRMNAAIGALDRFAPGLGNLARQNAAPALAAGLQFLGRPTELEGKRAVALPLRFVDGTATLGPISLGQMPPLY